MKLQVSALGNQEIKPLLDYWYHSSEEHLANMGADKSKLPQREMFQKNLELQIQLPHQEKKAFVLIWFIDGEAVGHSNLNLIQFGEYAHMHLHLWHTPNRQRGLGLKFLRKSVPIYFQEFQLKYMVCEPYAYNPAPNAVLPKLGFQLEKKYLTIPGSINFEQEVNRWILRKEEAIVNY